MSENIYRNNRRTNKEGFVGSEKCNTVSDELWNEKSIVKCLWLGNIFIICYTHWICVYQPKG